MTALVSTLPSLKYAHSVSSRHGFRGVQLNVVACPAVLWNSRSTRRPDGCVGRPGPFRARRTLCVGASRRCASQIRPPSTRRCERRRSSSCERSVANTCHRGPATGLPRRRGGRSGGLIKAAGFVADSLAAFLTRVLQTGGHGLDTEVETI